MRSNLADAAAVGAGHTAISGLAWYDADVATAERHNEAAIAILSDTDDTRALGFALANHAFLAAQRGDTTEARSAGARALQIADEMDGDPILHGFATIGVAVARLLDGDVTARADLLAARDAGLRQRHDDLATTPMSNLCHLDVEQGRFDDAEESIASALRISEERDTPICTMWQLGVRARLRLLQDDWPAAERDARAVLASGKFPLGRLWPRLVLGLLAARRDAPRRTPTSTNCGAWPTGWTTSARSPRPPSRWPNRCGSCAARSAARRPPGRRPPRRDVPARRPRHAPGVGAQAGPRGAAGARAGRRRTGGRARWTLRAGPRPLGRRHHRRITRGAPVAGRPGRAGRRRGVPRQAAGAGRAQHPARSVRGHAGQSGRAHRTPARRAGTAGGRAHQRRDRRAPGDLPQDRRPPRVGDPGQARGAHPQRGGGPGPSAGGASPPSPG